MGFILHGKFIIPYLKFTEYKMVVVFVLPPDFFLIQLLQDLSLVRAVEFFFILLYFSVVLQGSFEVSRRVIM